MDVNTDKPSATTNYNMKPKASRVRVKFHWDFSDEVVPDSEEERIFNRGMDGACRSDSDDSEDEFSAEEVIKGGIQQAENLFSDEMSQWREDLGMKSDIEFSDEALAEMDLLHPVIPKESKILGEHLFLYPYTYTSKHLNIPNRLFSREDQYF